MVGGDNKLCSSEDLSPKNLINGYWRGDLSDYFKDGNFDYTLRLYKKDAYRHVMEWLENK